MPRDRDFLTWLRGRYQSARELLAYLLLLTAFIMTSALGAVLIPDETARANITLGTLLGLSLILLDILFTVHAKVEQDDPNLILSKEDVGKRLDALAQEVDRFEVKYIGVAGRQGWGQWLDHLTDPYRDSSLVTEGRKIDIRVALIDPNIVATGSHSGTFPGDLADAARSTIAQIRRRIGSLKNRSGYEDALSLRLYSHLPNLLGVLVNGDYLFFTFAHWIEADSHLKLEGGISRYFVYDRNDKFGGAEMIRRFEGWWTYIEHTAIAEPSHVDA